MSGKELKQMLNNTGIKVSELASLMNTSQQNLSLKLNAADVKTGLIEDLCVVLNKDLTFFYGGTKYLPIQNNTDKDYTSQYVPKFLYDELRQEVYEYRDTIRDLQNQIDVLQNGHIKKHQKDAV